MLRLLSRSSTLCLKRTQVLPSIYSIRNHTCLLASWQNKDTSGSCQRLPYRAELNFASQRTFCSADNGNENDPQTPPVKEGFQEVYSIPEKFLAACRRIQFMKMVSLSVTTLSTSLAVLDPSTAVYASLFGLGGVSIAFVVMGNYVQNLACKLYINSNTNEVKISSLSFFGRRKDSIVDIDQVSTTMNNTETKLYMSPNNKGKFLIHVGAFTRAQRDEFDKYF